jgi:hypothetical protein
VEDAVLERGMGPIAVETELVAADYLRLTLWASFRNAVVVTIYIVNIVAVLAVIPGIVSGRSKGLTPFQIVFQAFILIGLPCMIYLSSRTAFRRLSQAQRSVRYVFTESAIETVNGVASSTVSWAAIQKVVETSAAFYLSSQKNLYQIVPKRSFKADGDLDRLRALAKEKLGSKAQVR